MITNLWLTFQPLISRQYKIFIFAKFKSWIQYVIIFSVSILCLNLPFQLNPIEHLEKTNFNIWISFSLDRFLQGTFLYL